MRSLDLDAARAARAEAQGEPPVVTFGGEQFTLPAELPLRYAWALIDNDHEGALKMLFNGQHERFLAKDPSRDDVLALIKGIPLLYGIGDEGESPASGGSSNDGSSPSRPTSRAATRSTSAKRAGVRKR